MVKKASEDDLRPHVIILPSYCPVALCLSRGIAEDLAEARGYKEFRIRLATKKDLDLILEGSFTVKEV